MSREHVERFKAITLQLDAAIETHGLESPEAEALRDESEAPWYAMTETERDEIRAWVETIPEPGD